MTFASKRASCPQDDLRLVFAANPLANVDVALMAPLARAIDPRRC